MNLNKLTNGKGLTDTEQQVLAYIIEHLDTALSNGVRTIASANYTSTSTIMRLAKKWVILVLLIWFISFVL